MTSAAAERFSARRYDQLAHKLGKLNRLGCFFQVRATVNQLDFPEAPAIAIPG
jgi:hypothetical protein